MTLLDFAVLMNVQYKDLFSINITSTINLFANLICYLKFAMNLNPHKYT